MKNVYFTVGPTEVYTTLEKHMLQALKEQIPSLNHRGKQFSELFYSIEKKLKQLLDIPDDYHLFFTSCSIESMERIIQNTVEKSSAHFINGSFAKAFYTIAEQLGKKPQKIEVPFGEGFDIKEVTIPKETELICITQNDTSTGVIFPLEDIYCLRKKNPQSLIAIDIVSSAPYPDMDFQKIDMAFFSVQKGFGLPAGLGVLLVNEKAIKKSQKLQEKGTVVGSYHSFPSLLDKAEIGQTPATPNVLNIYLFDKILQDMLKKGIKNIRREIDQKAQFLYNFFDKHDQYKPFVSDKKLQSPTTIVVDVHGKTKQLVERLKKKHLIVGVGYGEYKEKHIRIANFPAHTMKQMKQLVDTIK